MKLESGPPNMDEWIYDDEWTNAAAKQFKRDMELSIEASNLADAECHFSGFSTTEESCVVCCDADSERPQPGYIPWIPELFVKLTIAPYVFAVVRL
jgi:hypothetical protein